ncbi:exported protein of unknown function [Tenacibaculum sp. 190524A02b]|uniref:EndoU domain-containing protein n=1 Tax=Tenacibaculum vairaonense TaxID=3137860 RepID=UPI0032B123E8
MKNTKKKLKRLVLLGVLLISSSLIMYNCQPDNDSEQILHKKEEKQDFTYEENVDISEHEVTKELRIPKDKTTFRDTNLKTSNKSIPDIEVVTTSASRVTTADHQIYTFPLNNNCTTEYALQNLAVIKKNDGTLQYLLINYIKAETKNPNFPYHIEYKTIPNDLELVNINQLHRGDKASSSSAKEASEDRKCYRIGFLPCKCRGKADGHKPSDCPKCKGSPVGLIEIRCGDTSGTGATPDYEAPPCLECAIDPDGNAPVPVALPSNGGNTSSTGSAGNPPQQYTHNGEIICDSSGACNAPQFIPLISSQTFEQKLGLNVEQINILKSLEGVAFKSQLEAYAAKNNYSEHAKQQIKKAIEIFPHLNFLMKYWPKSPDEWAVIGEVFKSIAGELALGLVPGYDFVESVQHLVKGNIGQAALAFGFGIASFSPAILAKIGKVGIKLAKILKKIINIVEPLSKVFKKGYKPKIVDDVLELINRRGKTITRGADNVEAFTKIINNSKLNKHLFEGDISKIIKADGSIKYKVTGVHSNKAFLKGDVRIKSGTKTIPNSKGYYKAKIEAKIDGFINAQGTNWKVKEKTSTFFPDSWSIEKIQSEVAIAFQNKKLILGNKFEGVMSDGTKLNMFLDELDNIKTVFPILE